MQSTKRNKILLLYSHLLDEFGSPGAWPWFGKGKPHNPEEITIGAILTQNTSWRNVEYALKNLSREGALSIRGIHKLGRKNYNKLKEAIRPSGFYNQKAKRLFEFCKFIVEKYGNLKNLFTQEPTQVRKILLSLYGIGKETADTILLYAGEKPVFVIDTYTKRFAKAHGLSGNLDYDFLQTLFTKNLPKKTKLYQDYHALIVKWGKESSRLFS